jgi:hypothetical protein
MHGLEVYDDILSLEQCNQIIALFNDDPRKQPGLSRNNEVHTPTKQSTDIYASFIEPEYKLYNDLILPGLHKAFNKFQSRYKFLEYTFPWELSPNYNIQYYTDQQGFFIPHSEHSSYHPYRMLAWMIYLNNAVCGTEFPYQQVTLKAVQGNVAIWSAAWTHPHKGVTPNIGDKYIVTGWCEYKIKS